MLSYVLQCCFSHGVKCRTALDVASGFHSKFSTEFCDRTDSGSFFLDCSLGVCFRVCQILRRIVWLRGHTSLLLFLCCNLSVQSLNFSLKGVELCLLLCSEISACIFGGIYDFLLTEHFLLSLLLFVHRLLPPWLIIFLFI